MTAKTPVDLLESHMRYQLDFELLFTLNHAIMFYDQHDYRNACRYIERCIGVAYAAAAVGMIDSYEAHNITSALLRSEMRKHSRCCDHENI